VAEFAALLRSYRVSTIVGDKYAGEWPVEAFRKLNITYEQSAKPKSDLYRDLLPLVNSGAVALLDNAKLIAQFTSLERRVARGGRDSIDHAPGAHDDVANAVAGVVVSLARAIDHTDLRWIDGVDDEHAALSPHAIEAAEKAEYARARMRAYVWRGGGQRPYWSY
jgi:hypothetical protein